MRTLIDIGITGILLDILHEASTLLTLLSLLALLIVLEIALIHHALAATLVTPLAIEELLSFSDDIVHTGCMSSTTGLELRCVLCLVL